MAGELWGQGAVTQVGNASFDNPTGTGSVAMRTLPLAMCCVHCVLRMRVGLFVNGAALGASQERFSSLVKHAGVVLVALHHPPHPVGEGAAPERRGGKVEPRVGRRQPDHAVRLDVGLLQVTSYQSQAAS